MLRTRVITAVCLLPMAWALVFLATPQVFMLVAVGLLLVGTWEFHRLASLPLVPQGLVLIVVQAAILAVLVINWTAWTANPIPPFLVACVAWLVMLGQLWFYSPGQQPDGPYRWRSSLNALAVITFGWMALCWLRNEPSGEWWIVTLLLIIWASDIGAYFSGKAWGKAKLAPGISPGKTRVGLYGGLVLAAAVGAAAALFLPQLGADWLSMAVLAVITASVSVGGDLFISMHKRTVGLKDCGKLFPGHGGVLDRLDSLLAGAPIFALAKLLAGL